MAQVYKSAYESCKLYSIDLTTRNDTDMTGFGKRHSDVTQQDILNAIRKILVKFRSYAKTRNWKYMLYAVSSNIHQSEPGHRKGAWHLHILLYGFPASVMASKLKEYWYKARYGNSKQQTIKACWSHGKINYNRQQASSEIFQASGWTREDLLTLGILDSKLTKARFLEIAYMVGKLKALDGLANGTLKINRGKLEPVTEHVTQIKTDTATQSQDRTEKGIESEGITEACKLDNTYFGTLRRDIELSMKTEAQKSD